MNQLEIAKQHEHMANQIIQYLREYNGMESRRNRFQTYLDRREEKSIAISIMNRCARRGDFGPDYQEAERVWSHLYEKCRAMEAHAALYGWWW